MPNIAVPSDGSLTLVSHGVMKTVIGWLNFVAIVCSVASRSVVSEGMCTITAGLPPSSLSVNVFSMLKGNVCG